MAPKTFIALLRGINVSGRNMIPMPDLRSLCAELGWEEVQSYIQSGNLVFKAKSKPAQLETELEQAIERRFGFTISIIVRAAAVWPDYIRDNPFPDASQSAPNHVMLALSKAKPKPDGIEKLQARAVVGERIVQVGDALWLLYAEGVAKSKLSPGLLDRLVGSPVTTRNWRTVLKLHEMAGPFSSQE
ncbi:MAG TPA: DUF1697 domain-containing protein [Gemmataceae bacterium]